MVSADCPYGSRSLRDKAFGVGLAFDHERFKPEFGSDFERVLQQRPAHSMSDDIPRSGAERQACRALLAGWSPISRRCVDSAAAIRIAEVTSRDESRSVLNPRMAHLLLAGDL
jgi:hypothetical protein